MYFCMGFEPMTHNWCSALPNVQKWWNKLDFAICIVHELKRIKYRFIICNYYLTWRVKSTGLFKFTDFNVLFKFSTVVMAIMLSISCKRMIPLVI